MQFSIVTLATLIAAAIAAPTASSGSSASARFGSALIARGGWFVRDFSRDCTTASCTYNLGIDQDGDDVNNLPCTYVDTASDPNTHSFFGVSCQENNDFQLSWGWSPDSTFATMTIKQVSSSEQYYFGYLEPNSASDYADQQGNA